MTQAFWDDVAAPAWVAEQDALDRQLAPHDDALLQAARLQPGWQVIDSGCGAGALTLKLAQAVQPGGAVTGVDFSSQMLALARQRAVGTTLAVDFVQEDLETWDAPAASTDAVVSRLGLIDSEAMLSTLRRLLRPGGRLSATVFRDVSLNEWMLLPTLAVASVLPVDLPPSGAGGPFALAAEDRTRALLTEAGFRDIQLTALDYTVQMTGPGGGGVDVVLAVGPAAAALAAADDDGRAAAHHAVADILAPHDKGQGAFLKASAWLITAQA